MTHPMMMNCEHKDDAICISCAREYAEAVEQKLAKLWELMMKIHAVTGISTDATADDIVNAFKELRIERDRLLNQVKRHEDFLGKL